MSTFLHSEKLEMDCLKSRHGSVKPSFQNIPASQSGENNSGSKFSEYNKNSNTNDRFISVPRGLPIGYSFL